MKRALTMVLLTLASLLVGIPNSAVARSAQTCDHPDWVQGDFYPAGSIVRYAADGALYIAEHDNPGYSPVVSTWYWDPFTCPPDQPAEFVVTQAQFGQMFPNPNPFFSYQGLVSVLGTFPEFGTTGDPVVRKREVAAFLANASHATSGLAFVKELDESNYPDYCNPALVFGCPAGAASYYGRGPLQLSWNYNYKQAGDALGVNLLVNPWLVEENEAISWRTALWFWTTQIAGGIITPHRAMVLGAGFGETIRTLNGALECNGVNPAAVQDRVNTYLAFTQILGVSPGRNLPC
ncbi:chitinase [Kribbella sp. NPDC056861]|uniref:chitinase n=1 Tax=Kribbella sp. NPDC056861 TaxID=3154857 RepID=UPI00344030D9